MSRRRIYFPRSKRTQLALLPPSVRMALETRLENHATGLGTNTLVEEDGHVIDVVEGIQVTFSLDPTTGIVFVHNLRPVDPEPVA